MTNSTFFSNLGALSEAPAASPAEERLAFEDWMTHSHPLARLDRVNDRPAALYNDPAVALAWEAWQTRALRRP